jgi:uncharacterized membrane protein
MRSSRKVIVEFIGVFLIGTLVGGIVVYDWTDTTLMKFMTKTNDANTLASRLTEKYVEAYHLTPDEMTRIQPLIKEMAENVSQVRHQFGVDIIGTLDKYHEQISAQLTPDHRAAYDKANADRKKQLQTMLLLDPSPSDPGQKQP